MEFLTSSVKMVPSGSSVQPSSELKSDFPLLLYCVHLPVTGFQVASNFADFSPMANNPLDSTLDGESPINAQPFGCSNFVHVFLTGS